MRIPITSASARAVTIAFVGLAALYLVQLASPLRLDTDSASYLQIASSIADGHGAHPAGTPSFPVGYPLLVAGLDTAGLGVAWAIVLLNLGFLALATASLWIVLRRGLMLGETATGVVCVLSLLSTTLLKSAVMPLSEIVFYGLVAASLALLTLAAPNGRLSLIAAGVALALAACSVRTAGVALAPAVVLAFRTPRARIGAAVTMAIGATIAVFATPRYLDELERGWDGGIARSGVHEGRDLLVLLGAAAANVPESKVGSVVTVATVTGAAVLAAVILVLVRRRHVLGPVDGWVLGSLVLLYLWPSDVVRFAVPVYPFLLGYGVLLARRLPIAAIAYAAAFAAVGLVAITLSTRLTFSGDAFPERYASAVLAPTYRVAWGIAEPADRAHVYAPALIVLRRYDPDPP